MEILLMGGGTGTNTAIRGLRETVPNEGMTALVGTWDNGGSTGALGEELGVGPMGDARQAIEAMLPPDSAIARLMNYRFERGFMNGHPAGNIILAAAEETGRSYAEGIERASRELTCGRGAVMTATTHGMNLRLRLPGGDIVDGEYELGEECRGKGYFQKGIVPDLFFEQKPISNPSAEEAIDKADLIVVCSGKTYTSVGPHFLIPGIVEAIRRAKAPKVVVSNLMNLPGMTDGWKVTDHVEALEELAGYPFADYIVYNTKAPSGHLRESYEKDGGTFVNADRGQFKGKHYKAFGHDLLAREVYIPKPQDPLAERRTVIRHNPRRLGHALLDIYHKHALASH